LGTKINDLERWKSIARKATFLADRLGLALDYVEQNDPELAESALEWANKQLTR
jgi:Tfp pilus assembly protein PilF